MAKHRRTDWPQIYKDWLHGVSAVELSHRYALKPQTISKRCSWIDQHFPPSEPVRLISQFIRYLNEACKTLERGDPQVVERQAKALLSLVKVSRALEDWTMDNAKTGNESGSVATALNDPKAELERRLMEYAERERKAQLARSAELGRGSKHPVELENMGADKPDTP